MIEAYPALNRDGIAAALAFAAGALRGTALAETAHEPSLHRDDELDGSPGDDPLADAAADGTAWGRGRVAGPVLPADRPARPRRSPRHAEPAGNGRERRGRLAQEAAAGVPAAP